MKHKNSYIQYKVNKIFINNKEIKEARCRAKKQNYIYNSKHSPPFDLLPESSVSYSPLCRINPLRF